MNKSEYIDVLSSDHILLQHLPAFLRYDSEALTEISYILKD